MQFFDAEQVASALPYESLVDELERAFRGSVTAPTRAHHTLPQASGNDASLLLMPAWNDRGGLGVKIVTVFPDNASRQLGAVNAVYCLLDGTTGQPRAVLDGEELTQRRTAAASALASRYLSRENATSLLMIGTGNLAPYLIEAHCSVRPIERVMVWGRDRDKARLLCAELASLDVEVEAVADRDASIAAAQIISCATLAAEPLVRGRLLSPGQHLDLVGAFTPSMREADGDAFRRSAVYVDTLDGALAEAGDLLHAIAEGALTEDDIRGELAGLVTGTVPGRQTAEQITIFKSVGTALEDLAAAEAVVGDHVTD